MEILLKQKMKNITWRVKCKGLCTVRSVRTVFYTRPLATMRDILALYIFVIYIYLKFLNKSVMWFDCAWVA